MRRRVFKSDPWSWCFTGVGTLLVVISGLLVSVWLLAVSPQSPAVAPVSLAWWRTLIYGLLLLMWPKVLEWLVMRGQRHGLHRIHTSRLPLLLLIVGYEGVIVHNPLAALLRWVG